MRGAPQPPPARVVSETVRVAGFASYFAEDSGCDSGCDGRSDDARRGRREREHETGDRRAGSGETESL